jgi:hypothetical protein
MVDDQTSILSKLKIQRIKKEKLFFQLSFLKNQGILKGVILSYLTKYISKNIKPSDDHFYYEMPSGVHFPESCPVAGCMTSKYEV